MPTYEARPEFARDLDGLTDSQKRTFREAVGRLVADLRSGTMRTGLRVKKVAGHPGIWEMTWAPDGRATFAYGPSILPGERHVIWRRVGTHGIFRRP